MFKGLNHFSPFLCCFAPRGKSESCVSGFLVPGSACCRHQGAVALQAPPQEPVSLPLLAQSLCLAGCRGPQQPASIHLATVQGQLWIGGTVDRDLCPLEAGGPGCQMSPQHASEDLSRQLLWVKG